jgi:arsenite methyltransferase
MRRWRGCNWSSLGFGCRRLAGPLLGRWNGCAVQSRGAGFWGKSEDGQKKFASFWWGFRLLYRIAFFGNPPGWCNANVSVVITMKTFPSSDPQSRDHLRQMVREHYGQIAEANACGCSTGCCTPAAAGAELQDAAEVARRLGYSEGETGAVPDGANLGLGCGNPLAIASLRAGETVLDLGSGAGFDAFLAARAVGQEGRVIGVDMTPAMITKARGNAARAGYENTEFRLGEIENLPVADASVDVILSNCVINLSPDKGRVFTEAWRVLKPGGRLAISDVVALKPVPPAVREDVMLHVGCVAGAAPAEEVVALLAAAGFTEIRVSPKPESAVIIGEWFPGKGLDELFASAIIEAVKPAAV